MTDKYAQLREKQTGGEFGPTTDELIAKLQEWDEQYGIEVSNVYQNSVRVSFDRLPEDMQAFAEDIYEIAVDTMAQHYDIIWDLVEHFPNVEEAAEEFRELILQAEGVEMHDSVSLMAKDLTKNKFIELFWD